MKKSILNKHGLPTVVACLLMHNLCGAGQIDAMSGARVVPSHLEYAQTSGNDAAREGSNAFAAFEELLRAFEVGDVSQVQQKLDPSMMGYQQLLDNITSGSSECRHMKVQLYNTQVHAQPDLVVIQTNWEKRCPLLPEASTQRLSAGRTTILMNPGPNGWTFSAISAGNMFDRALFTAAISVPTTCTVGTRVVPCASIRALAQCVRRGSVLVCP